MDAFNFIHYNIKQKYNRKFKYWRLKQKRAHNKGVNLKFPHTNTHTNTNVEIRLIKYFLNEYILHTLTNYEITANNHRKILNSHTKNF